MQPSPLDEEALQTELRNGDPLTPQEYTKILAESKAHALAAQLHSQNNDHGTTTTTTTTTFVLGSDTIVDYGGEILEKPKNTEDAVTMLSNLSDAWHAVHTGVALYRVITTTAASSDSVNDNNNELELVSSFVDTSKVKFASLTEEDIHAYVETGEPMDKAGSYGIQGIGGQFVEKMEGDFFTVMGLPMHRLSTEMAKVLSSME